MTASRWRALVACAAIATAIGLWLWPRGPATDGSSSSTAPADATAPGAANARGGVAGSALREAVQQSGAPGSTPPLQLAAAPADGFVEARVVAQGRPRQGALVRLYLRGPADPNTALIDWRFAGAAATGSDGIARIPARAGTYLAAARWGSLAPARIEFQRPAGERATRISLELQAGVSLFGKTMQKGALVDPVPLALVTLAYEASPRPDAPSEEQARATSDALGRFRIDGLAPGRYRATAQATGFAKSSARIDTASRQVTLFLSAASFIEGHVVAGDGTPAAGAEVFATGGEENQVTTLASERGSFSLEVAPRSWTVGARRGNEAGRADASVAVAAGATARGVKIQLSMASSIAGVVIAAATKQPIANARIAVSPYGSNGDAGRAASDASGAFAVQGLPPGSYDVEIAADGYAAESRRGVTVSQGQRFPLRIELRQTGAVEGVVRDASSRPVAFALVSLLDWRAPGAEARADDSGAYRLPGIAAGRHVFVALREGAAQGTSAMVEVLEGGAVRLDFQLADEGVVTGRVRRVDGSPPPPEASVTAFAGGAPMVSFGGSGSADRSRIPVDAAGVFFASLPAGEYELYTNSFRSRVHVAVEAGKTTIRDLLWSEDARDDPGFGGLVLEPDGTPSPGASVLSSRREFRTEADELGRFHSSRPRGDLPDSFEVIAVNGGHRGTAAVTPEQTEVTVLLQPGAILRGHLQGERIEGFHLELSSSGTHRSLDFTGDRFELRDLPAESSHLFVTTLDGRAASRDVTLAAGAVQEIEIPVKALARLAGRIVDSVTREPIDGARLVLLEPETFASTGADGRFSIRVLPGNGAFSASSNGYVTLKKDFSAQEGKALDLGDVLLEREHAPSGGIGVQLRGDSDMPPTVVHVIAGSPADIAGVRVDDKIAAVDGVPVLSVTDAIVRIRGGPATPLQLVVRRGGAPLTFNIIRAR
jgi:hypothetical protein